MFLHHLTFALLLSLLYSLVQAGETTQRQEAEGILEMEDAPLADVLAEIAAMDGHEVVLRDELPGRRVSVVLQQGNFEQNLKRALRGLNYVLTSTSDKKHTIWVFATGDDDSGSYEDISARPARVPVDPERLFPDGPLLVPPSEDGEEGYTEADVAYYRSTQTPVDPALSYVVPPDENGLGTRTQLDVKEITDARIPLGPDSLVLPPALPGEEGVTIEEMKWVRGHFAEHLKQSDYLDVVPPD